MLAPHLIPGFFTVQHPLHARTMVAGLLIVVGCLLPGTALASHSTSRAEATIESISLGFAGKVLLGRWTPVAVRLQGVAAADCTVAVSVLDGDAVPVVYQWSAKIAPGESGVAQLEGLIRIGRTGPLRVEVRNADGTMLAERRFLPSDLAASHEFLAATTRLTLVIGAGDGNVVTKLPVDRGVETATAVASRDQHFPEQWIGYESVDHLVLMTHDPHGPTFSTGALAAMARWNRLGGRVLVSCGANWNAWFGGDVGVELLGVPSVTGSFETERTGPLELFTGATDPLAGPARKLTVVRMPGDGWLVDVEVVGTPVLMHRAEGMGILTVMAMDFAQSPLAEWSGTRKLLARALLQSDSTGGGETNARAGRVTHNGYDDLSGQLRAALDRFRSVTFVTFTAVALLVTLFILLIGPLDWFLLRRVFKRMEWTWVTFPLLSLLFCALAVVIAVRAKSPETQVNQVEIVDLDSGGEVRGTVWSQLYSPDVSAISVATGDHNELTGPLDDAWLSWQGLPGTGLGGMQSRTDLGLQRRDYRCEITASGSRIDAMPVQSAATRALIARWTGKISTPPVSRLRQSPTTDAVLGTVSNPFDVRLHDCMLLYGDWAYLLERPLEPGETIVVEDDMREQTIRAPFTRRRDRSGDEVTASWNPVSHDLKRILEAMMFFEINGGRSWTTLASDYQRWLDMSWSLDMGSAVLVGRLDRATTPLVVDGQAIGAHDHAMTLIRVRYPVQPRDTDR